MGYLRSSEFTQFPKSKPWGYHPQEVEKRVLEYEKTIAELTEKYLEKEQIIMSLKSKIDKLQDELREMHLEMSSLELPEAEEAVERCVLDEFRNYNNPEYRDAPEPPPIIKNNYKNPEIVKNEYKEEKIEESEELLILPKNNNSDNKTPFKIVK